jgi:hypothetical protein
MTRYNRVYDRTVDRLARIGRQWRKIKRQGYESSVREAARLLTNEKSSISKRQRGGIIDNLVSEHVWTVLGLDLLDDMSVEARIKDALMPHDAMAFVFPHGTRVAGLPCRNAFAFHAGSKATIEIVRNFYADFFHAGLNEHDDDDKVLVMRMDLGEQENGSYLQDGFSAGCCPCVLPRDKTAKDSMDSINSDIEYSENENQAILYMISIMVKALLYVQAVKAEGLDPTPRPQGRKARTKGRKRRAEKEPPPWEFTVKPTKDILRAVAREGTATNGKRKGPRPHMRGWVLRVLRHERFKRNEDGSPKTVLVEPAMIGTKNPGDLRGGTKAGGELRPES